MTTSDQHPAIAAARASWRCVERKDKQGWLDLMADDICIEDPIGQAPTNPTGQGVQGKEAVAAFFDQNIAPSEIRIEAHESYAAGLESAHLMTVTARLPGGLTSRVRAIFTYRVNEQGKLTNLRGYWTLDQMTFEQAS